MILPWILLVCLSPMVSMDLIGRRTPIYVSILIKPFPFRHDFHYCTRLEHLPTSSYSKTVVLSAEHFDQLIASNLSKSGRVASEAIGIDDALCLSTTGSNRLAFGSRSESYGSKSHSDSVLQESCSWYRWIGLFLIVTDTRSSPSPITSLTNELIWCTTFSDACSSFRFRLLFFDKGISSRALDWVCTDAKDQHES